MLDFGDGRSFLQAPLEPVNRQFRDALIQRLETDGFEVVPGDSVIWQNDIAVRNGRRMAAENVDVVIFNFSVWAWPQYARVAAQFCPQPIVMFSNVNPRYPGLVGMLVALAAALASPDLEQGVKQGGLEPPAGEETALAPLALLPASAPADRARRLGEKGMAAGNPVLIRFSSIRDRVNREGIRGVIFDLKGSGNLQSDDPNAHVQVIVQSEADWWMDLGHIPLKTIGDWKTIELMMTQEKHTKAAYQTVNIWLVLRSKSPVKGSVFIDKAGFLVR